jgi:hypothetical protein
VIARIRCLQLRDVRSRVPAHRVMVCGDSVLVLRVCVAAGRMDVQIRRLDVDEDDGQHGEQRGEAGHQLAVYGLLRGRVNLASLTAFVRCPYDE